MTKFIYSFGIILFGLSLGYVIQILVRREQIKLPIHIDDLRKLLQRIALLFLNPIAIVGAIWVVSLKSVALVALPFIGLSALLESARRFQLSNLFWCPFWQLHWHTCLALAISTMACR